MFLEQSSFMASVFRTLSIEASALNYQQESIILQQYFHPTDKYTFWSCLKNNLPSFGGVSFYNDVMVAILPLSVTGQGWASEDSLMILLIEEVWEGKKKNKKKRTCLSWTQPMDGFTEVCYI